jgi:hypothetical protein
MEEFEIQQVQLCQEEVALDRILQGVGAFRFELVALQIKRHCQLQNKSLEVSMRHKVAVGNRWKT